MYKFNPMTQTIVEVKEATRFERIKRTPVPGWVMLLITFVPPLLIILCLIGCGSEEIKTVEYYKTHVDEGKAKIAECKNNPGVMKENPNCINAIAAYRESDTKHVHPKGKTMDDFMPTYTKE
ncbi:EexN family lipoprotein [Sulfurospirillum deleyianum]|uniref:EexN family lipoprotein n=1 Tax=Sulfurospirillum deleyianum (strain ATCC 51133 / DSM 6946 / 5175) TaxID=525898 RepID=D1B125_SULD5|nr:EexN family lipoprotein [Sulfurospirillum deleyianum]ACZ11795.1 hypothetical protein Sdel_0762 [Sulfurospirillum deleyianum DSM 6946]